MTGTLYGLGVGPGDPELITVKALRILRAVPVIAYPATEDGLSMARNIVAPHLDGNQTEFAIRIPIHVGPEPSAAVYDAAAATISEHLEAGRDVAVLCEGDPFFYGSFVYLFARLSERFPVRVVPGISSLTACAAELGAPLAARNDVLAILPAPLDSTILMARLAEVDAAAIIKLGRHAGRIVKLLGELGLTERCRYIERATMANQRILPLTALDAADVPYFSIILMHRRGEAWT